MQITAIAYLAAFFMLIMLFWMVKDYFMAKKQEFYQSEMPCLDMLRQELDCMENVIMRHTELARQAQKSFDGAIAEELRDIYAQTANALAAINYDRNVFVDKGITWPGQRCYDIYRRLAACDPPLGFCAAALPQETAAQTGDVAALACITGTDDTQCAELESLATKFSKNKLKVFKRLEIYK